MKNESYKTLLLGEATVGKTSIADRFRGSEFSPRRDSTIGAAYTSLREYKLELWDTAGQERFNSIVPIYFRDTDVALLVYDVSRLETVNKLKKYIHNLSEQVDGCQMIIVGNKTDLPSVTNKLQQIERNVKDMIEEENYPESVKIDYFFVSAKENNNIKELLKLITEKCQEKTPNKLVKPKEGEVVLSNDNNGENAGWFSTVHSYCNIL